MKQAFLKELNCLNISLSKSRKEELYQYWLQLQKQFILNENDMYQKEWIDTLKKYFFKSIEYYPAGNCETYFESIYGILSGDNLWYSYETMLISDSYDNAYNWMYQNRDLVIEPSLSTSIVIDSYLSRAQELYIDFMVEEMIDTYPEYSQCNREIFNDFMFLVRYYPYLPNEIIYDNMNYEMCEKHLHDNEKLSYLFGMCYHDVTCMSSAYWAVVTPRRLQQEKIQYYQWLKYNSYNDILLNQFVEQGIEDQAYRLTNGKQKMKHIVKE